MENNNFLAKFGGALVLTLSLIQVKKTSAGSDSSVINFSAVFGGGSCDISTSVPQIKFGGGESIKPSEIVASPPHEEFNILLRNCAGWGMVPKITVSGESTILYGQALFRDAFPKSTSEGYGVLLSTVGNKSFKGNLNLAANKIITAKVWSEETELSSIDAVLPVKAELTCGNCNYINRKSGELIAAVTFNFIYD